MEAIVHFSGGSDSTYCAAAAAEKFSRVHLLTYDRISFIGARDYTLKNYQNLCRIYGAGRFERQIINVEKKHRQVCYHQYLGTAVRFKLGVTSLVFSKLAMHWASAEYARKNGIATVWDGSAPYMAMYPDQNPVIAHVGLTKFYADFGIKYETPIYGLEREVEEVLYDKGITPSPQVRGTENDFQVYYLEQVLLALFFKYYTTAHGHDSYEKMMKELYADRLNFISAMLRAEV